MDERDDLQRLIEKEEGLKNYSGEDEIVKAHTLLDILHEYMTTEQQVQMQSGIPGLDKEIHHFLGGELIVISGPTKHGKTLFAQTLTRNFSAQGIIPLWFSYEVPPYQFLQQFGEELPNFVLPKSLKGNSFSWIIERTHEAKLKFGINAVFIDNTHNVINLTASNLSQIMGEFLKAAKSLAIKMNVAVFLLHHMVKIKPEEGEGIGSHLLRDSSMVAQTADTVMFIWRDKDMIMNPGTAYVKVTENRRYGVMNHIVTLQKQGNFLEEKEFRYGG